MRGVVGWRGGGAYRLPGLAGTLYSRGKGGGGRGRREGERGGRGREREGEGEGREGTVRVEGRGREEKIGVEERREGRRGGKKENFYWEHFYGASDCTNYTVHDGSSCHTSYQHHLRHVQNTGYSLFIQRRDCKG